MSSQSNSVPKIILFDVQGHAEQPWAPNNWRIRFILNRKNLNYRTERIDFQHVASTMQRIGANPTSWEGSRPIYALPVIYDETRHPPQAISNTNTIVEYLETMYPRTLVIPEGSRAMQTLYVHHIQDVVSRPLLPILIPQSLRQLPEQTRAYFRASQSVNAGVLEGPAREGAWAAVKAQFDFLASILDKNTEGGGVLAMGDEVSYADFALCSILIWIKVMGGWHRVRDWNGGRWQRLWDVCSLYMEVR